MTATTSKPLHGVIAAVATAVDGNGEPDSARSAGLARFLLANGCDGLNVLGTTGEATSFSLEQRKRVMSAYAASGLPIDRMMVGTGAAALADAIALTRHAAELGFGGALVLPPFYYKGVHDDGLVAYIEAIVNATAAQPIPLYLYHYPAQSGLHWHVALIRRLLGSFGERIVGLKDSSGDMDFARAAAGVASEASKYFLPPKRRCRKRAPDRSPAASRRPPISIPICAPAPIAPAMPQRLPKRSPSANYSTASRWSPASRRCSPTFTATRNGRALRRRFPRSRHLTSLRR